MLQFLLDTDHLTLFDQGDPTVCSRLAAEPSGTVGISIVTVEEYLRGRLAQLARARDGPARIHRYGLLLASVRLLGDVPAVPFDQSAEDAFQRLLGLRLRVGTQDLKIAAVGLANQLIVVTRNHRDFSKVPGLGLDDWSV
jgi:tRNA(fMet)-specific endonuclease VapC